MKFTTFDISEEKDINAFLEGNRELIGKDSYWNDQKTGRLCFMYNDAFDPAFARKIHLRVYWQKHHETLCQNIADIEAKLARWKELPDDEKVGEKDLSGSVGGMKGVEVITAKKGIEMLTVDKSNYEGQLKVLERLLSE